jgi:hypothetical protein
MEAWLGFGDEVPMSRLIDALEVRRRWAQAQQANPKHEAEARFIIRHHRALVSMLQDNPTGYRQFLRSERAKEAEHSFTRVLSVIPPDELDTAALGLLYRSGERLGVPPSNLRRALAGKVGEERIVRLSAAQESARSLIRPLIRSAPQRRTRVPATDSEQIG